MIEINIPEFRPLKVQHLVLDFNGTLAVDGSLLPGVAEKLEELSQSVTIHVLTADTFGLAKTTLNGLPVDLVVLSPESQIKAKRLHVLKLGAEDVVAIGNGRNDQQMLKSAALGIAVIQTEGACVETLLAADVVTSSIHDALDLLRQPKRLVATLRS